MTISHLEGNYFNKYQDNGKILNFVMEGFFNNLNCILDYIDYDSVYEAGCGEGYISQYIYNYKNKKIKLTASDISEHLIKKAKEDYPYINFKNTSIYTISETNDSYDLVLASEVLEHLEAPDQALSEIFKISKKYVFISVPNEPIWRIANFCRGKYIKNMGNTPGHINHWSERKILQIIRQYGNVLMVKKPFPWIMILCEKNI